MITDKENSMRKIRIEKVILNVGGTGEKLDKGYKLLEILSGRKPIKIKSTKRIPTWNVRPGLETGTKVTLRGQAAEDILNRLFPAVGNTLKERQIRENFVSFGVKEYIEIQGMEYIREVGIMGFEATIVFVRPGKRVERKKVKRGDAGKLAISPEEIEEFLKDKFKLNILRRKK